MNILSIQSHVAYGHVGNSAAAFPLERMGFEVWRVNTVQFSNHTGYAVWRGRALGAAEIAEVVEGLAAQGIFASCDAVLSGYLGAPDIGRVVLDAVAQVRAANPAALFLCDPVMGDRDQGLFVAPETVRFMREDATASADFLTPNLFELERLVGRELGDLGTVIAAAREVLARGPRALVVTSLQLPDTPADSIQMLAVTPDQAWRLTTPLLPCDPAPNGAGDLFAALFLAHVLKAAEAKPVVTALQQAAAAVFAVVAATHRAGSRELQVIAAQEAFVSPLENFQAERLD